MSTAQAEAAPRSRERYAKPLFLVTILTGSFLLFLTQPMIARMALPRLGGAPAVWNSAMLVYQALLLGGYAYAHYLSRLRPRRQAGLHLILFAIAAFWLPIGLSAAILPLNVSPALWTPWFLIVSIGPLFFIVSAQAPLMQRWYALESARGDPYPLYAASNLGSFAGLLSYPLLVEPFLSLHQQSQIWTAGYVLLVLLVACCALTIPAAAVEEKPVEIGPAPDRSLVLHWVLLAAVPSGLMLSTTTHLTTDIVAMPLLWVVPLALYLLSFTIAFAARRRFADFVTGVAPLILLICGGLALSDGSQQPFFTGTLGLLLLFTIAVALHSELYRMRPAAGRLTHFYLAMAAGGVLGGLFCALAAPLLFDWAYEHPLLLLGAALLLPQNPLVPAAERMHPVLRYGLVALAFLISWGASRWFTDPDGWYAFGGSVIVSLIALVYIGQRALFALCLAALMLSHNGWERIQQTTDHARIRSYFGIYTLSDRYDRNIHSRQLTHGTTLHGVQNLAPGLETEPTTYYARRSGIGDAMRTAASVYPAPVKIGVVGLGAGTLSCYAQPGQDWRFFEIDPAVVRIARDSGRFTFLRRCAPQAKMVLGDARLSLARQPPGSLNLIALDAFSSDAVPMHLLTREALMVYRRALSPDGLLMVHISNRYLDLEPVLAQAARAEGWSAAIKEYVPSKPESDRNASISVWIAMSRDPDAIMMLRIFSGEDAYMWRPLRERRGFAGWSDDHASILPLLEDWRNFAPNILRGR